MSKEAIAIKALEALARLGNGDQYGNSTGNVIARTALFEMAEQSAQQEPVAFIAPPTQCWKCGDMDAEFQAKCNVPACGMKEQQMPRPYGWAITGSNELYLGKYAENDAKVDAESIGGLIAFPLYTSAQPAQQEPAQRQYPTQDLDAPLTLNGVPLYPRPPAPQDIPDLIAGALGVSRGTAYDLMREALAEQPAQQCVCGEPETSGTHRIDGPCYAEQPAQTEAERLADELQEYVLPCAGSEHWDTLDAAAAELRRLVSFNQQLMDEVARLQKREWVGLTDEDGIEYPYPPAKPPIYATANNTKAVRDGFEMGGYEKEAGYYSEAQLDEFAQAIEAKLKEKNT